MNEMALLHLPSYVISCVVVEKTMQTTDYIA